MSLQLRPSRILITILSFASTFAFTNLSYAEKLTYAVDLPRQEVRVATEQGVSSVHVDAPQYTLLSEEGFFALPYRVVNVLLPQGEKVGSYTFDASAGVMVAQGISVARAGAMISEDGVTGRGAGLIPISGAALAAGSASAVYPEVPGRYLGTGYLHGRAIASFAVFPVRVEGEDVVVSERVTLDVTTVPLGVSDEAPVVRERYREGFEDEVRATLEGFVVNPEDAGRYQFSQVRVEDKRGGFQPTSYPSLEGSAVDYVIITTDALAAEYQRLADWKTAKGVPTVVRTVEWIEAHAKNGVDLQETIRFFVRDAYAKWGVTYVLLGGDTDILPPRYALSRYYLKPTNLPVDMYFACLDGSWNDNHDKYWGEGFNLVPYDNPDLYAEVYEGRIPMSTVSLTALMIDKVIAYETPCDASYQDRYLFLAEVLFPTNYPTDPIITQNGADFAEMVKLIALNGKPLDVVRMYETEWLYSGSVHETRAAALDSLNAGFNHVNDIGHGFRFNMSVGDASIQVGDADALTNGCRYMNLYMLNCTAAAYDFYCLAEHFLTSPNGGAVSVIGANNSAFPNASSNYMNEYYDLLFNDDVTHIGETFARSRLPRTPTAMAGDNADLWTHYIYTILADPEMPLFTGSVETVNVAHVGSVGLGTTSILVNVTSGGEPVDSAYVCLSKGGDDYQRGATNALGNAVFSFRAESAGQITVVVTGHNIARHQSTIPVTPGSGAYVSYASMTVDDNTSGGSFGNADGVVDAGETIDMTVSVVNTGVSTSGNVTLVLRCSAPGVSVTDSTAAVGTVGVGVTKAASDPFRVMLASGITDERAVEFRLVVKEGGTTKWNDRFKKEVHAPELVLTTLRIYDGAPLGDGDGVNEPGEQFRLYYGVKNYGTGLASGLTATLKDLDGQFVFYDSTDTYVSMGSFVERENVDGFHIKEMSTSGENRLEVTVTDLFSRVYRDTIELRVPLPPTALVFDASLGPDRMEITWTKSASTDVVRYNVYHSLVSGGPYTQANVDPLEHAVYLDTGLSASTPYFFVVTAIDRSGNESVYSAQGSASTNPPQLAGFPIKMKAQTTSAPAVGDIDGDGDLEIVVGNQWIYAWHHTGLEIRDGDGDPQSWGVLTTVGDQFTAPVALVNLDNHPGLDIVAADLNTKKVYVVNYLGQALSGWPRQAENDFRAAPTGADLDGDGFYEVVAVDSRGIIYAWHANGVEWLDGDNNPATQGVFYRTTPVYTTHFASPTICDIDEDHKDEIIMGTRADSIWAFNGNRSRVPGFPVVLNGDVAGSICAGDVDGDGRLELLAQSKGQYGKAFLFNHDGTVSPGWPVSARIYDIFFTPSPALGDFNNDGKLECVVYMWDAVDARINVLRYTGAAYTGWPKAVSKYYTDTASLTVADLNGDGSLDIVLGDESRYIYAWSISGTLIPGFPVQAKDAVRSTPFLTDVDKDGGIDMIVHSWDQNIYAFDLPGAYNPARAPWPTYQANVHRNGLLGFDVPSAIGDAEPPRAELTRVELFQNHPNPFNPTTEIEFVVPEGTAQQVTLIIYDVTGARVATLVDEEKIPGLYTARWDGRDIHGNDVGSGVYFCRLLTDDVALTKKMILLK